MSSHSSVVWQRQFVSNSLIIRARKREREMAFSSWSHVRLRLPHLARTQSLTVRAFSATVMSPPSKAVVYDRQGPPDSVTRSLFPVPNPNPNPKFMFVLIFEKFGFGCNAEW